MWFPHYFQDKIQCVFMDISTIFKVYADFSSIYHTCLSKTGNCVCFEQLKESQICEKLLLNFDFTNKMSHFTIIQMKSENDTILSTRTINKIICKIISNFNLFIIQENKGIATRM